MSPEEAKDLESNGFRGDPKGGTYEGKLFATSDDDVRKFGQDLFLDQGQPFIIVTVAIPPDFYDKLYKFEADGRDAVSVDPDQLDELNKLGVVHVGARINP